MTQESEQTIPQKLKSLRRARGLSVTKLAEKMGENHQKIGRIERGMSKLNLDYLMKVSKALETPIDSIVSEGTDFSHPPPRIPESEQVTLSDLIMFIEENAAQLNTLKEPQKKAELIAKIAESSSRFSKQYETQFLKSLLTILETLV